MGISAAAWSRVFFSELNAFNDPRMLLQYEKAKIRRYSLMQMRMNRA
jgi:hypothetical protein